MGDSSHFRVRFRLSNRESRMLRITARSVQAARKASEIPAGAMAFSFASPIEEFYSRNTEVTQVDIPTQTGMIGVLPTHVPTFGCLAPGVMTVMQKGSQEKFFVSSGSYTVNPDSSVSVIAEDAAPLADFDKEKAMAALNSVASGPEGEIETAVLSAVVAAL